MTVQTRAGRTQVASRVRGHIGRFGYVDVSSVGVKPDQTQKDSYTFAGRKRFDEMKRLVAELPCYIPVASEYYPNDSDVRDLVSVTGQVGDCAVNLIRNTSHDYTHLIIANEEPSKRQATLKLLGGAFA